MKKANLPERRGRKATDLTHQFPDGMTAGLLRELGFFCLRSMIRLGAVKEVTHRMLTRYIQPKPAIRLAGVGIILLLACIGLSIYPDKAEAGLLDAVSDLSENLQISSGDGVLPDLKLKTPSISLDTPIVNVSIPSIDATVTLVQEPQVSVNVPPIIVETPVVDLHLPDIPVSIQPSITELPGVQQDNADGNIETGTDRKEHEVPHTDRSEKSVTPEFPSAERVTPKPIRAQPVHAAAVPAQPRPKRSNIQQKQAAKPAKPDTWPRPRRAGSANPWPAAPLRVLAGSGSTSGNESFGAGGGSSHSSSPGLLFPVFLLDSPKIILLDYERSQLYGSNQWSKPPPIEPPRYALLLMH